MADSLRMALQDLLRKAELEQDADFLRDGAQALAQALMGLEVSQHLGAERYERSPERRGERNGYHERTRDTRVGTLELRVPRVRTAASSRACSSRASEPSGPWWPWSRRPTCRA